MARWKKQLREARFIAACGLLLLTGCTTRPAQTPDERIKQQAAQSAQQMRHDMRDAGKETRRALAEAGRETRAAVAGAREGWKAGAPTHEARAAVDLNHASALELEALPGVHAATARRIVAGRPYRNVSELEKRGIVSRDEYARIEDRVSTE